MKSEKYKGKTITFEPIWYDYMGKGETRFVMAKIKFTPTIIERVKGKTKKEAFANAKKEIDRQFKTGFWGEKNMVKCKR